jgi:hypothetical protein
LAAYLKIRHEQTEDVTLLGEIVTLDREILDLCPNDRPRLCGVLAVSLRLQLDQTDDITVLNELIVVECELLASYSESRSSRVESCHRLARYLFRSFEANATHDTALLDEGCTLMREAYSLCSAGDPDRAEACLQLAGGLALCSTMTNSDAFPRDEEIPLIREALALRPRGHPDWEETCDYLITSLICHCQTVADLNLINETINLQREVLSVLSEEHDSRAASCRQLAVCLIMRYEQFDDSNTALLNEAIGLGREALRLCPVGHSDHALCCGSLAVHLTMRYDQTGDPDLLDEVIVLERKHLKFDFDSSETRAQALANLATSLFKKSLLNSSISVLQESIRM